MTAVVDQQEILNVQENEEERPRFPCHQEDSIKSLEENEDVVMDLEAYQSDKEESVGKGKSPAKLPEN